MRYWDTTLSCKAFYNQVAKPRFADFARAMTSRLIGDMTLKVFGFAKGRAVAIPLCIKPNVFSVVI